MERFQIVVLKQYLRLFFFFYPFPFITYSSILETFSPAAMNHD